MNKNQSKKRGKLIFTTARIVIQLVYSPGRQNARLALLSYNRYFQKYVHGKYTLSYQDIVECLVPHSDYILMSTTAHKITERPVYKQHSVYLCKRSENQIVKKMVALIVNTQIEYLKTAFIMMDDITNGSLKFGALLWRNLDRQHDNCLTFERMATICRENGVQFSESQWKAFINWHFRSHRKYLKRADFMIIFDSLMVNKRNGSNCNIEQFSQSQILKKSAQSERLKKSKMQGIVSKRLENLSGITKRSQSSENLSKKKKIQQIIDPEKDYGGKRLLYCKLGYKCPENLIKMSEI